MFYEIHSRSLAGQVEILCITGRVLPAATIINPTKSGCDLIQLIVGF
jgi:hypothetical protein